MFIDDTNNHEYISHTAIFSLNSQVGRYIGICTKNRIALLLF